jgi:hypothetical protein
MCDEREQCRLSDITAYLVKGNHKEILKDQYTIQVKEVVILVLFPFGFEDEPAGEYYT